LELVNIFHFGAAEQLNSLFDASSKTSKLPPTIKMKKLQRNIEATFS
jgi:hypothetical protein